MAVVQVAGRAAESIELSRQEQIAISEVTVLTDELSGLSHWLERLMAVVEVTGRAVESIELSQREQIAVGEVAVLAEELI